ncbi:MAG TPA: 6-phospho-beta-glucosidase [Anaerolineae bacterium]|nr:6-phospho-beta-glucosidase [Anaerolineae bacterium]
MKVAVIGGGSTYTPELVRGFLERAASFPLTELWLMDVAAGRLATVGGLARRMIRAGGAPFRVVLTGDLFEAIDGAAYVITQLRVGGMEARREDEYLGQRHGLIGQETTGIGGMAKALRTIPVILEVAGAMRGHAPGALLVNFTNPSGLITEALWRYAPGVPALGVCNVALTTKMEMLAGLGGSAAGIDAETVELDTLGLNHLTWHRGLRARGEDLWPQVLAGFLRRLAAEPEPEWGVRTIESLGMIPNSYLQYYYYTHRKLAEQAHWPPSRAEEVMAVEEELLRQYGEPDRVEPPPGLLKRGGAYYSTVATQLLSAHYNNRGETHVANVRHGGAVRGWPADWVLEMPCRVDGTGVHALPADPLPPVCFGLLAHVKAFELLTVEAAVHGDRTAAYQALLAHPLGPSADRAQAVLDDLLEANRRYLPGFWEVR